jgi:AcrR family transcriptional regulator
MSIAERRLEEKERRREEIIAAAVDLALEHRWDGVTMDGVAKRARLSRALVYIYFKDREELHAAVCELACAFMHKRFAEAVARHRIGGAQIEAIGRAYVAFAAEMPHLFEVVSRFETRAIESIEAGSNEHRAMQANLKIKALMVETIERGMADGSIRRDAGDPQVLSLALWGLTHGVIQIAATKGAQIAQQGVSTNQLFDQAFEIIRRAIIAGDCG